VVCYVVVVLKPFFKYDDSLDAFGVHGVGGFLGALLTGIFASTAINPDGANGGLSQLGIQTVAACVAVAYSFVMSLVLVKVIDLVWGFCLRPQAESEGLDRAEHGEVGFDFGLAYEQVPEAPAPEPRAANVPPDGHQRFTVVLEGGDQDEIGRTWSDLCQPGHGAPEEFRTLYPYVTTVQGNRFRFRGGDPATLSAALEHLFESRSHGQKVRAHVET
jgi:hypothetical protein